MDCSTRAAQRAPRSESLSAKKCVSTYTAPGERVLARPSTLLPHDYTRYAARSGRPIDIDELQTSERSRPERSRHHGVSIRAFAGFHFSQAAPPPEPA